MDGRLEALAAVEQPLPPGGLVLAEDHDGTPPALWRSNGSVDADLVCRLRSAHPRTGLWPLLIRGEFYYLAPSRMSSPGAFDGNLVLAGLWHWLARREDRDTIAPFDDRWPGVAPASPGDANPQARADALTRQLLDRPDNLWQGHPHTIREYAPQLLDANAWMFWWD